MCWPFKPCEARGFTISISSEYNSVLIHSSMPAMPPEKPLPARLADANSQVEGLDSELEGGALLAYTI